MGPVLLDVSLTECAPLYGTLLAQMGVQGWPHAFSSFEICKISVPFQTK